MTDQGEQGRRIKQRAHFPPGFDEDDVYSDINLSQLPGWWQRAIEEHDAFGLRPYRPPRFYSDEIVPPVVEELEEALGVDIKLIGKNVAPGDDWSVVVDGQPVFNVGHRRTPEGYSRFEIDRSEFMDRIKKHAKG